MKNKSRVDQLVTIFRYLQSLSDMVNIYLTEDRLYIQGMDASHACLCEVAISSKWFDTYNTVNMTLGVSCKILFKVINCWKDGQEIKLHCEDGGDKLYINFNGGNNINKDFALPLIEIDTDLLEVPVSDYPVDLELDSDVFKDLISEMSVFSESLSIGCDKETVSLCADGECGKMTTAINEEDIEMLATEEDYTLDISLGINYISTICNFNKINKMVYLHLSNEQPVKIHYSLDDKDSNESNNYIRFFIATKID